ncbi:hypothetical protein SORBI_3005G018600 [Sorghum bicolor]|uniref:Secreted protein n=1 Tax=Sorghum bicolor TaxID=4558 RepID=A0A1B6PPM6_SORBI|nr:hypothetical protein SORBI_3005G018600 [Sorghum bicolor]
MATLFHIRITWQMILLLPVPCQFPMGEARHGDRRSREAGAGLISRRQISALVQRQVTSRAEPSADSSALVQTAPWCPQYD